MPLTTFHPLLARWFRERFAAPTEPQRLGWPAILAGKDTLIAAPTGSGKTLAAFLASLDRLLRLALAGNLREQTYVAYVSPLRALSNDIQRNLQTPLAELLALAREDSPGCGDIRALVRTGDTSPRERQQMLRKPPHILVTTPESLYLLLTGKRSRDILRSVDTVIVDEIHALARDKRGSHLSLSLERLDALCADWEGEAPAEPESQGSAGASPSRASSSRRCRPVRIGLSATQKPLDELAQFLVGASAATPTIVDMGHVRELDLAVEVPPRELEAVCSHEHWAEVYERLVSLIGEHRSTLIFVNTRRLAERVAHQLKARLGEDAVATHHGSLSHDMRRRTEQRLKDGELKAVVATASLELGIDVGHIDLVCQLGTPRAIATFLQRVGRAGHSLGVVPKGRLFALTREEQIECLALVRAVFAGRLDRVQIPRAPLDILAQQIVAASACDEWDEDALFDMCRRAYPYRELSRADYDTVLQMLSEGVAPQRGRWGAHIHRDRVNRQIRGRRGARLTAITCGGAIPEIADYRVVMDNDDRTFVGTVDEDFAVESMAGDIFLLGNTSWRIRHVRGGEVIVSDAHGAPPTIPFWRGEAPGRTFELSFEVARLREDLVKLILAGQDSNPARDDSHGEGLAGSESCPTKWLERNCHVSEHGARQAVTYVTAQQAATGMVPTQKKVLFERFFDESGGMQLVVHAPFGTRINRAWGLAMRKRFCRSFDFELQASADDNGIVLSLGAQHSFPLEQMFRLVPSHVARDTLVQAFLAVPFFTTRWRWNATRALAIRRADKGRRVPPPLQRMRADDLLSAVFPAQTACQENVVGDIEVPDHPLVNQTVHDCLNEATDIDGFLQLLHAIESGQIEMVSLDSREPSPFAHELLNASPYAFLDDAPLEERRARAVTLRRSLSVDAVRDLGRLDPEAIAQVCSEAWPLVRDADELHDTLLSLSALPATEGQPWQDHFDELLTTGRAATIEVAGAGTLWIATERLPLARVLWPDAAVRPERAVPAGVRRDWEREEAVVALLRGRLECVGPVTAAKLARDFGMDGHDVERGLAALESEGIVLRGRFTAAAVSRQDDESLEWCERRLLSRIHRLTLEGLRRQIQPVSPEQYLRFLARHQHLHPQTRLRSEAGLLELIEQLQGFEAPAGHWERYLLPPRMEAYNPAWLDSLTFAGQVMWGRLRQVRRPEDTSRPLRSLTRVTPITLMLRDDLAWLLDSEPEPSPNGRPLSGSAQSLLEAFGRHGAMFIGQLGALAQLLPSQVEEALGELAAAGLVTSDGFPALRGLMASGRDRRQIVDPRLAFRRSRMFGLRAPARTEGGRWSLLRGFLPVVMPADARIEKWCRLLLRRYGVMFRDLLAREASAPTWQELVRGYRRLEARGEIRGGRFVADVAGEQYALPDVVSRLRQADANDAAPVTVAATDPLNLSGRVLQGPRVPASPGRLLVIGSGS